MSPETAPERSPGSVSTLRNALATAGILSWIVFLVPPVASWSRHYEYAQAIQYCFFAVLIPALLVTGAPWRWLGLAAREPHALDADGRVVSPGHPGFIDRMAISRSKRVAIGRAYVLVGVFAAFAIFWRVTPVVDSLVRHAWIVVPESLSLVAVGTLLWLDLVESPPLRPSCTRPYRIGMSAVSMWVVWVLAYLGAMSHDSWYPAFHHVAGQGISMSADQQLSSGFMWMLTAGAFLPVVFWNLVHWLQSEEDPSDELYRMVRQEKALRTFGGEN